MIEDTFNKLKSNLELTQTFQEKISRQYNAVKSVIENNHAAVRRVVQIGSVGRKTRIMPKPGSNAEFDIDMLVVLGEFDRWVPNGQGISKEMAMESVQTAVKQAERYAKKNPERDNPTVTFTYDDGVTIELVPAYEDKIGKMPNDGPTYIPKGRAFWVPSRTGWQLADYEYEAAEITKANAACGSWLIPAVKMLKAAKREHFPSMSSFHLEVIATARIPELIAEYKGRGFTITYPLLVGVFLHRLAEYLPGDWGIPGSLSPTFRIGATAAAEITAKAPWLKSQVAAALSNCTDADRHRHWKPIFNDWIPMS